MHGLTTQYARKDIRKYSFAVRFVEPRNQLPNSIRQAESKEAFKRALKQRKKSYSMVYNSPASRFIDDECSGENVKQMQGGRPKRHT